MTTLRIPHYTPADLRTLLRVRQGVQANVVSRLQRRETTVSDNVISACNLGDDGPQEGAQWIAPYSLRLCVLLIFLGAAACYGLGYVVFLAFQHVISVLH